MVALPEEYLKTVAFLCVQETSERGEKHFVPKSTSFMVAVQLEGTEVRLGYFVTARHCIYAARAEGHRDIFLRLNRKTEPGYEDLRTDIDDWLISDTDDVAALLFVGEYLPSGRSLSRDYDVNAFPLEQVVGGPPDYKLTLGGINGFDLKEIQPKVGNEIYFIGLFSQNYGVERSLPVARFGHISRMPGTIEFQDPGHPAYESTAYLAELQSWGGHSGSPVFFWEPQTFVAVEVDDKDRPAGRFRQDHGHITAFMGLISHHYDVAQRARVTGELGTVETALNSGIAIVVPAHAISLLLTRMDAVTERAERVRERMASGGVVPTPDYAASPELPAWVADES